MDLSKQIRKKNTSNVQPLVWLKFTPWRRDAQYVKTIKVYSNLNLSITAIRGAATQSVTVNATGCRSIPTQANEIFI